MAKKVRIKDIASRLGLSSTLVSMVLNNKANQHGIKAETQERVVAAARNMGYFSSDVIDTPSDSTDYTPGIIGMIVTSLKDPFVIEISEHLRKAFASIGFGFSIISWDASDIRFTRITSGIKKMYSGIILTGDTANDQVIRSLKNTNYPFVVLEKPNVNLRLNAVRSDCKAGAKQLAQHLQENNYEKFTIIKSANHSPYVVEKLECIIDSLQEQLPRCFIKECVLEIDIANKINEDELIPFLRQPVSTEVLIVSEAALVYPLLESLGRLNIRIPQDIALVSLENGTAFDLLSTPVTRLKRDIPGMSSKVVSMLWTEIKNSGKSKFKRTASLAPELIIAKSSTI